jgi:hypothetical protein
MNATDRIVEEFDRLEAMGRAFIATRPGPERIVYYVVAARCEIDINGFGSLYAQGLDPVELAILIDGLNQIGEGELAGEFRRGFDLLKQSGYCEHRNWNQVSEFVKNEIEAIGERVGDRLWTLDHKLAALLPNARDRQSSG